VLPENIHHSSGDLLPTRGGSRRPLSHDELRRALHDPLRLRLRDSVHDSVRIQDLCALRESLWQRLRL
jgi:hypothetical protein